MFRVIFADELARRLRSFTPWLLILLLAGYTAAALLGADTPELGGGGVPHNGSFVIYYQGMYAAFWVAVLGPFLVASPVLRDIRTNMAPLVHATRISDACYFWGKYLAGLAVTVLVLLSVPATIAILPPLARALGGGAMFATGTRWRDLVWTMLVWTLPACLIYGTIHFALAARTGRLFLSYGFAVLSMAVFTVYFVGFKLTDAHRFWIELTDPMGKQTLDAQALLWSVPERTYRTMRPTPVLLGNRLLYLLLGAVALAWAAAGFRLDRLLARARGGPAPTQVRMSRRLIGLPRGLIIHLAAEHWRATSRSPIFRAIYCAILMLGVTSAYGAVATTGLPGNQMLPYAQYLFTVAQPSLYMILAMMVIYFAGEIAARDRDTRMAPLINASRATGAALVAGRWLAIAVLALVLALLPSLAILIYQLLVGFIEPEPQHFARSILLQLLPPLLEYGTLVLALDLLIRNRLVAQGVPLMLLWAGVALHETGVVTEKLTLFALPQPMLFSGFAVLDADTTRQLLYAGWWLGLAGALLLIATALDRRGERAPLFARARGLPVRVGPLAAVAGLLLLAVASAATIHHELHGINESLTPEEQRAEEAGYERRYGGWATVARPLITAEKVTATLDPAGGRITLHGAWTLRNPSGRAIDALLVNVPEGATLALHGDGLTMTADDETYAVQTYRFARPLASGTQTTVTFAMTNRWRGFTDEAYARPVGRDVMLLDRTAFPRLNYDRARELGAIAQRRMAGLPPRRPPIADPARTALDDSAGRVSLDLTIIAPAGFQSFASGIGQSESRRDGSATARFTATRAAPDPLMVVVRGLVPVETDWRSPDGRHIGIRLFHRPAHGCDVALTVADVRAVLNRLTARFGPPPFSELSLVETPQFLDGEEPADANASGPLVLIPERGGWLHDQRRPAARDDLLYSLGREIGRSWWRTRRLAASGPGAAAIDEGMPITLGLDTIAAQSGLAAARDYAATLRERLRREIASSDLSPTTPGASTDQPYAGLQAGLALFDRWYPDREKR